jgi:hypothetical protein
MAKKITFKRSSDVPRMIGILRTGKIEHVRVQYPAHGDKTPPRDYIVVKNRYLDIVRTKCGDNNILRIKNARHYENICLNHIDGCYFPKK